MSGPAPAPGAALQTSAKSSAGASSGVIIGVLAAGAVVAGGVCYKLLKSGKSKPAPSPAKKVISPAKKTVAKRTASSVAAEPSGAAAATATTPRQACSCWGVAAAAPAAAPVSQRSAAPLLPARPATKKAVPKPAAPASDESAAAAKAAAEKAATEKAAAEKAAAEKAAAEKAAAEKAAAEKAAAEKAASEKAAAEKAAAEKAAAEKAAAEKAAAEKAAAEKAAAGEAAAAETAAEEAAAEKAETDQKEDAVAAAAATAAPAAAAAAAATAAAATAASAAPAAEPAAAEPAAPPAADGEAAAGEGEEGPEVHHHVLPTSAELAALVLPAEELAAASGEGKPAAPAMAEQEGPVERLADMEVAPMSFEGAPSEGDLNEVEQKAREMSLHAHKVVKEKNNVVQGSKEQKAALDLLLQPENAGKARPQLVAACAFALGDMLLAQRKIEETKAALAVAYHAATHIEDKGPMVRALMNYAYITKSERKAGATEAAYREALALARAQHGARHGMVEKIKYEMSAFLGSTGREAEAANMLIQSASELLAEAEKLAAEAEAEGQDGESKEAKKEEAEGGSSGAAAGANGAADPPSGFEHAEGEAAAAAGGEEEEEESMTPVQTAQHFAMRNLMNAAGVLDGLQQYTRGEELLAKALDIAVVSWGAGSMQHLNVLYALAQHFRRREMLQESIDFHEQVLAIMDESIQVYSPELLQNRIAILRDVAVLMDKVGQGEAAVDYATGALVNAQTLAGIMMGQQRSTSHPILEPFYRLLADLKAKIGDEEGAAEARRMLNESKLQQRLSQMGKQQQRGAAGGKPGGKRSSSSGASTARAGGRRV
ncbi:hypothetical protein ABPG77_001699 [Micractinium sp. CCAP 211/92]